MLVLEIRLNIVSMVWDDCCCVCSGLCHFGKILRFFFFFGELRGDQKDDEEVFSETCQNSSVSQWSGNSSCHKVRSSRPNVGRLPLGLNDLTSWHEELPDYRETATILTCVAEHLVEGWTRSKFGGGREKRGSGGGKHAQTQLLRSWTCFLEETHCLPCFRKNNF